MKDRIKDFRRVRAGDLLANPRNWRTHPSAQQAALRGILDEVGIAGALIARETPEGLELIDGHLRADEEPDAEWPVLVLDVTEAEADKLLATYDPLSAMAVADADKLQELLSGLEVDSEALERMLADLEQMHRQPTDEDWAQVFDDLAETNGQAEDLRQVTFVLKAEEIAVLLLHLKQYHNAKNEAFRQWLIATQVL